MKLAVIVFSLSMCGMAHAADTQPEANPYTKAVLVGLMETLKREGKLAEFIDAENASISKSGAVKTKKGRDETKYNFKVKRRRYTIDSSTFKVVRSLKMGNDVLAVHPNHIETVSDDYTECTVADSGKEQQLFNSSLVYTYADTYRSCVTKADRSEPKIQQMIKEAYEEVTGTVKR